MTAHVIPPKTYYLVFAALLVLLVVTVAVAQVDLGLLMNLLVALTIAGIKALLIVLYFMHIRYSSALTRVVPFAGLVWLTILITLTLGDYFTRNGLADPSPPPPAAAVGPEEFRADDADFRRPGVEEGTETR